MTRPRQTAGRARAVRLSCARECIRSFLARGRRASRGCHGQTRFARVPRRSQNTLKPSLRVAPDVELRCLRWSDGRDPPCLPFLTSGTAEGSISRLHGMAHNSRGKGRHITTRTLRLTVLLLLILSPLFAPSAASVAWLRTARGFGNTTWPRSASTTAWSSGSTSTARRNGSCGARCEMPRRWPSCCGTSTVSETSWSSTTEMPRSCAVGLLRPQRFPCGCFCQGSEVTHSGSAETTFPEMLENWAEHGTQEQDEGGRSRRHGCAGSADTGAWNLFLCRQPGGCASWTVPGTDPLVD